MRYKRRQSHYVPAAVSLCPDIRHQTSFLFLFFLLKSKSCCSVIYSNCSRKTQERGQRDALQSRKAQQKQKGGKSRRLHSMLEGEIDRDVEPALYFSFTGTSTYTHALIHPHPPPGNHIPSLLLSLSFAHYGGNRSDQRSLMSCAQMRVLLHSSRTSGVQPHRVPPAHICVHLCLCILHRDGG